MPVQNFAPLVRSGKPNWLSSVTEVIFIVVSIFLVSAVVEGIAVALIISYEYKEAQKGLKNHSTPKFEEYSNMTCFSFLYGTAAFQIPVFNVVLAMTLLIYVVWILYRMNQYNLRLQYVRTTKVIREWDDTESESEQELLLRSRSQTFQRENSRADLIDVEDLRGRLKRENNWIKRRCLYFKHLAIGYMLPLYFSLVHWFTLVDFLVLVWMLIAAAPNTAWFRVSGVLIRTCYRLLQFVALVVLFMPVRRAKSNPGIVIFDWRRALLLACPIAVIPNILQLIVLAVTENDSNVLDFYPQVDVALCTPEHKVLTDGYWDKANKMSITFWIARDGLDLLFIMTALAMCLSAHSHKQSAQRPNTLAPASLMPRRRTSLTTPDDDHPGIVVAKIPFRCCCKWCCFWEPALKHEGGCCGATISYHYQSPCFPRMALVLYLPFFAGTRILRLLADVLMYREEQWGLCVIGMAYFIEQVMLPGVVLLSLAHDTAYLQGVLDADDPLDDTFVQWGNLPGVTGHEIHIDDVQCEKVPFGRSQYEVFKGRFHGAEVAVKKFRMPHKMSRADRARMQRWHKTIQKEITIFARLRHPNVVTFFGYCIRTSDRRKPEIWAVMELMDTDLLHLIAHADTDAVHRRRLRDSTCNLVLQIAAGMRFLHGRDIIHRDIKSPNVLVLTQSRTLVLKIADFGCTKELPPVDDSSPSRRSLRSSDGATPTTTTTTTSSNDTVGAAHSSADHTTRSGEDNTSRVYGTNQWLAPEAWINRSTTRQLSFQRSPEHLGKRSDVFSFGMVLWEILSLDAPPRACAPTASTQLMFLPVFHKKRHRLPLPDCTSAELPEEVYVPLERLMQRCWKHDPGLRPTFDQICDEVTFIMSDTDNSAEANRDTLLKLDDGDGAMVLSQPSSQQFLGSSSPSYYGSISNDTTTDLSECEAKSDRFVSNDAGEAAAVFNNNNNPRSPTMAI